MTKEDGICDVCRWRKTEYYMCNTCRRLDSCQAASLGLFYTWLALVTLTLFSGAGIPNPTNQHDALGLWGWALLLPLTLGLFGSFHNESEGAGVAFWAICTITGVLMIGFDWHVSGLAKVILCTSLVLAPPILAATVIGFTRQPWLATKPPSHTGRSMPMG